MEDTLIAEETMNDFRRIAEVGPEGELPVELLEFYVEYKRLNDICSQTRIETKELIVIYMMYKTQLVDMQSTLPAEPAKPAKAAKPDAKPKRKKEEPKVKDCGMKEGDPVKTIFKGEERTGLFVERLPGSRSNYCSVKIDGDDMNFRNVKVADTKLLSEESEPEVPAEEGVEA
jgi:hypothetical protein